MNALFILALATALEPELEPRAPADAPVSEAQAAEASELFASARAELATGHYETALEQFRRADELVPHPATKFHMARCLEQLGRLREAWELYGVVAEHADVTPAERTAAAQRRAEVRSRLATVRIRGRAGGKVTIDGASACETPCTLLADPGMHALEATWPDQRVTERFELGESEVREVEIRPPAPRPAQPIPPPPDPAAHERPRRGESSQGRARWPTAITWVGVPLSGLGTIGVIGFGSATLAVRRDHDAAPTMATQTRGERWRALTNASIGVAVAGGVLLVVDAVRYGVAKRRQRRATP